MSVVNLRKRFELAVGQVITQSFTPDEEVGWWVTLDEIDFGECDTCHEPVIKPAVRVHLDVWDPEVNRWATVTGLFPPILLPAEIRQAVRDLINGYRIAALEDKLSEHYADHHHRDIDLDRDD